MRNHNQEYLDNTARKYSYDFDHVIRKYLLSNLSSHFKLDGPTLELGCYRGDMTAQILGYFHAITVVEAASDLAILVKQRFTDQVSVVNATFEAAVIDGKFDNIFLVHTLEHLDDPITTLARIGSWLSPNGRLFIAVPNANALSRQIAVKMGLVDYNAAITPAEAKHGHRCTYSMDVLLATIRKAGLRAVEHGGVLVKPMANFQFDRALEAGIVDDAYLDACNELAKTYPDLSASLFAVCANDN